MDLKKNLPKIRRKPEFLKLAEAFGRVRQRMEDAVYFALKQADLEKCTLESLYLHAWARGIQRYPGENNEQFRLRVVHAKEIRRESGSRKGLERLLEIYGATNFSIVERAEIEQWDIVEINLDPSLLSVDPVLLIEIVRDFGRTCRKYYSKYTVEPVVEIASAAPLQVQYVAWDKE